MDITITLTDTQYKGLEYAALSPEEWAVNAVTNRARIAVDEIVSIVVQHCLDNNIAVPATRDEIVTYAYDNALITTLAQKQAEIDAADAADAAGV